MWFAGNLGGEKHWRVFQWRGDNRLFASSTSVSSRQCDPLMHTDHKMLPSYIQDWWYHWKWVFEPKIYSITHLIWVNHMNILIVFHFSWSELPKAWTWKHGSDFLFDVAQDLSSFCQYSANDIFLVTDRELNVDIFLGKKARYNTVEYPTNLFFIDFSSCIFRENKPACIRECRPDPRIFATAYTSHWFHPPSPKPP
jgi:hypothetical protein